MRVVYLHGFASGPQSRKARFFSELLYSAGVDVTVPDLAEGRFRELTVTAQLAVIARACRKGPVTLIGSSMGGYLAALYAARHAQVERVVLMAPAFAFAETFAAAVGEDQMNMWLLIGSMEVPHYADNCMRELGWQLMDDARDYEDEPDFQQPGLIFHGVHDTVVPVEYSRRFAGAHPNVRLIELDSGHDLTDVMDRMGAETLRFLGLPG